MIEHRNSEAAVFEDDFSIVLGIAGEMSGERVELTIQLTRNPDEQDVRLGHDTLYLEYAGTGDYGLIRKVSIGNERSLSVFLEEEKRTAFGIKTSELCFSFDEPIDTGFKNLLRSVCNDTGVEFQENAAS